MIRFIYLPFLWPMMQSFILQFGNLLEVSMVVSLALVSDSSGAVNGGRGWGTWQGFKASFAVTAEGARTGALSWAAACNAARPPWCSSVMPHPSESLQQAWKTLKLDITALHCIFSSKATKQWLPDRLRGYTCFNLLFFRRTHRFLWIKRWWTVGAEQIREKLSHL